MSGTENSHSSYILYTLHRQVRGARGAEKRRAQVRPDLEARWVVGLCITMARLRAALSRDVQSCGGALEVPPTRAAGGEIVAAQRGTGKERIRFCGVLSWNVYMC